jgi:hypothetical protein
MIRTTVVHPIQRTIRKFARSLRIRRLSHRWNAASTRTPELNSQGNNQDLNDVMCIRVINLEHRNDRLSQISAELARMGLTSWERVEGFYGTTATPGSSQMIAGSIGCELSHIAALSEGIPAGTSAIMVCEDDLEFVKSREELELAIAEFLENPLLDVLSISGRARGGSFRISDRLRIVVGLVGRGSYVVKPRAIVPLIEVFAEGLALLQKNSIRGKGDLMWRKMQQTSHFFAAPVNSLAQQSGGYSDIEGKNLGPR